MSGKAGMIKCASLIFLSILAMAPNLFAGNQKLMAMKAAEVIAERALVESIYGLKLRATEDVIDMAAASFEANVEAKTSVRIKGIKIEDVVYDAEKDIAKVTASVRLPSITNIDGVKMDLKNKVFRRVGFATSTNSMTGPLKALRAAEIDAYAKLIKRIVGFDLESKTTVKNFLLSSDTVKTKVMATLYLAELVEYGWDDMGDAYVKMAINTEDASSILGKIMNEGPVVEVEGHGAGEDDFKGAGDKLEG